MTREGNLDERHGVELLRTETKTKHKVNQNKDLHLLHECHKNKQETVQEIAGPKPPVLAKPGQNNN